MIIYLRKVYTKTSGATREVWGWLCVPFIRDGAKETQKRINEGSLLVTDTEIHWHNDFASLAAAQGNGFQVKEFHADEDDIVDYAVREVATKEAVRLAKGYAPGASLLYLQHALSMRLEACQQSYICYQLLEGHPSWYSALATWFTWYEACINLEDYDFDDYYYDFLDDVTAPHLINELLNHDRFPTGPDVVPGHIRQWKEKRRD